MGFLRRLSVFHELIGGNGVAIFGDEIALRALPGAETPTLPRKRGRVLFEVFFESVGAPVVQPAPFTTPSRREVDAIWVRPVA